VAGEPTETEAVAAAGLATSPDLLVNSLGEYTRVWIRRVRSGESGALPVILGLVALGIYFQLSQSSFLGATNIANLMGQAGWIITLAMAQTFILLLGEIDLSVGFNAAIGGLITVWMVSINNPYPVWLAIVTGLVVTAVISAIEGLIVVWLRIPSFVVTLAGLLGLNGVLIWLFEKTGSVGQGGSISLRPGFLNDLVNCNMSPAAGWIVLIAAVVLGGLFLIMRDRRRHANNLVAPPLGVTLLKIGAAAAIGAVLVLVLNVNRATTGTLQGVPWVVPIVLALLVATTILLSRTKFGRYMYAVGGNAEAARRAGINLSRIRVLAFALCGLFAGITGILYSSQLGSMNENFPGGQYVLYSVAGGGYLVAAQLHVSDRAVGGRCHLVMQALEARERESRREVDLDVDGLRLGTDPFRGRGGAQRCVYECRVEAGGRRARVNRRARRVARRDGERQFQCVARIAEGKGLEVGDLDRDARVGRDVGDSRSEHVGTFLIDQARLLAFATCLVVGVLRLDLFLDVAADGAVAQVHEQLVNGGVVGQRKHVQAFNPILARIGKLLGHVHPRDIARHLCVYAGGLAQRLYRHAFGRRFEIQRARAGLLRLRGARSRCGAHPHHQNRHPGDHAHIHRGILVVGGLEEHFAPAMC
jgi:D-xylose transport system permease protein